jgi:hypothetical protein
MGGLVRGDDQSVRMGPGEISALVSGAVAITAIVAGEYRHRSSLRHTRELADLDNVRDVLDEVVVVLHEMEYLLNEIRVEISEHGLSFFELPDRVAIYDEFTQVGIRLDRHLERLKIRLGSDHESVTALEAASRAAISIHHSLKLIKLENHKPALRDEDALNELRAFFGQQRKVIAAERKQFDVAHSDFVAKAQRAAGVKLPT